MNFKEYAEKIEEAVDLGILERKEADHLLKGIDIINQ